MATPRKSIPAATQAALWALSNGRCYFPGCAAPVVVQVRDGVYRKNAQMAHIYGVAEGAPRFKQMPESERDSFPNLLLLCYPHHNEIDDEETGEELYPATLLRRWKTRHEGENAPALQALPPLDEDTLNDLLVSVFTPPVERLAVIAAQLEKTGVVNAQTVLELKNIVGVMAEMPGGLDSRTVTALGHAAEVFGNSNFTTAAKGLAFSAEALNLGALRETARMLMTAADQISASARNMRREY
jgi:hypothetical protein